jgi:hypothetical protein
MTNRDLLKEAIADAKAVKEVAITNAKAALEEAFTPHLKEMFEKKMKSMEEEDDLKEYAETQPDRDMDGDGDVDADDVKAMSEAELEELLKELNEAEEEETEEKKSEKSEEEGEEEEEEIDLDDMTKEDLEKFIEEVVDEMIEAGELEAGHEGMEDEAGAEMEPEMGAEEMPAEEEAPMMENQLSEIIDLSPDQIAMLPMYVASALTAIVGGGAALANKEEIANAVKKAIAMVSKKKGTEVTQEAFDPSMVDLSPDQIAMLPTYVASVMTALISGGAALANKSEIANAVKKAIGMVSKKGTAVKAEGEHEEELQEAYKTIKTLRAELNEINLLNSKLLYTNKIFKAKNLSEAQKVKVLTAFDKAETVKEVKLVFETLNEGLEKATKKELVRESKSFASKTIGSPSKQPVMETNPMVDRFKKLAGLI